MRHISLTCVARNEPSNELRHEHGFVGGNGNEFIGKDADESRVSGVREFDRFARATAGVDRDRRAGLRGDDLDLVASGAVEMVVQI